MAVIKDDLGRTFVDLATLSRLLSLSIKQTRRHIRDKRMVSVKRGRRRFVLIDDILKQYPHITPSMFKEAGALSSRGIKAKLPKEDVRDTKGTSKGVNEKRDVPNVPYVPKKREIELYKADERQAAVLKQIEQVQAVVNRLEKSIADMAYLQQDTKSIDRKLTGLNDRDSKIEDQIRELNDKESNIEGQMKDLNVKEGRIEVQINELAAREKVRKSWEQWIYPAAFGLVVIGLIFGVMWGIGSFKEMHRKTQKAYEDKIALHESKVEKLTKEHTRKLVQNAQESAIKDLELEGLKRSNEHLEFNIKKLQGLQE
jgi:hypothetical protein